jgi:hypothetical protein
MDEQYLLTYTPIAIPQQPLVFPCDARGRVDLNALNRRELNDYLFARASVGIAFAAPQVTTQFPAIAR